MKLIKIQISKADVIGDNELEGFSLSVVGMSIYLKSRFWQKCICLRSSLPENIFAYEETASFRYVITQNIEFGVKEIDEIQSKRQIIMRSDALCESE